MPELSFIVPVYRAESYLNATLQSLRAQTFPDWEAILVDDGSPDKSGLICDEAARQDARFRVIHQANQGVGAARNAGIAQARGTYLHFLDADDTVAPEMAQELLEIARRENADLVLFGGDTVYYNEQGMIERTEPLPAPVNGVFRDHPCEAIFPDVTAYFVVWRQLFRRELLEKANCRFPDYKIAEDVVFFLRYLELPLQCIVGVEKPLYHYAVRPNGSASQKYYPERLTENFYMSQTMEEVGEALGIAQQPAARQAIYHCRILDLQFGIKNVCLSPLRFAQRAAWLKNAMQDPKVREAVAEFPVREARSRNDRIKLQLLKLHCFRAVILLSSLNNRKM